MRANWHSLREFEALRAVIAMGTATAAARRLGISQSAVSRAIAQLEARTGRMLFERNSGRMSPTAEALALNENLDPLFGSLMRIDSGQWSMASTETLRIIATPTLAHRFLPQRLASFIEVNPDQRVSLEICTSDELISAIADERHDIGVMDLGVNHNGVRYEPFRASRAVCFLPKGHRLSQRRAIRAEHLIDEPFVALMRRHRMRAVVDRIFSEAGIEPRIVVETATLVSQVELVRRGIGISIGNPFPVAATFASEVEIRPFEPELTYQTCFVTPSARPLPAIGRAFIRHVRMSRGRYAYSKTC